jgi:hypothetical protein
MCMLTFALDKTDPCIRHEIGRKLVGYCHPPAILVRHTVKCQVWYDSIRSCQMTDNTTRCLVRIASGWQDLVTPISLLPFS